MLRVIECLVPTAVHVTWLVVVVVVVVLTITRMIKPVVTGQTLATLQRKLLYPDPSQCCWCVVLVV